MSHPSQESIKVAQKFVEKKEGESPLTLIGIEYGYRERGRRVVTDGKTIWSYGWWPIAFHGYNCVWVADDHYYKEDRRGRTIKSPTTEGHIQAVVGELHKKGYQPTEQTFAKKDNRKFILYQKGN